MGNKIVDHSDVVGASPVGELHLHSRLDTWLHWIGQRQPQDEMRVIDILLFGAIYIRDLRYLLFILSKLRTWSINCIRINFVMSLHWRHNDHDGVSNHQPHGCLLNRLFRRRSKKTSKLRVTGFCVGNSPGPVNSPHKGPVTRKMFPFDHVIM